MAFFSEIFFSTLIGKPVYTLDEQYFGNFRDFIVKRQNENFLITKVRIRTKQGKRVIVAWHDMHSIEADPVSLKLNLKIHEIKPVGYDEDELRLKRDFLDQQIVDTHAHRVVRVNDLKIVAVKDELFMVAADIGLRGLLRRIGLEQWVFSISTIFRRPLQHVFIPSKYIDPFPARIRHDITLTVAQDRLKQMHPADLADIVTDLDYFERMSMLQTLPLDVMAKTVAELAPKVRKTLLAKLQDETITEVLEKLAPDTATDIAAELPKHRMQRLLAQMKNHEAEEIKELLKFRKNTAGSIMNTQFIAFSGKLTALEALDELRKKGAQSENIFYLYIIDGEQVLIGVISLRDLIFVDPKTHLRDMIKKKPVYVKTRDYLHDILGKFSKYNLIAMPVVNRKKKLQGIITVDDLLPLLRAHI